MSNLPVEYYPNKIEGDFLQEIYDAVIAECKVPNFEILGKVIPMRRMCCLYRLRDREIKAYYDTEMPILDNPPACIQEIQRQVESLHNDEFSYVLVNVYRDDLDSLGWHRDKESLDNAIASVSLGATRRFEVREEPLRRKKDEEKTGATYDYVLRNKDLIYMQDTCQRKYKHRVPPMSVKDLSDHIVANGVELPKGPKGRKTLDALRKTIREHDIVPLRINLTFHY